MAVVQEFIARFFWKNSITIMPIVNKLNKAEMTRLLSTPGVVSTLTGATPIDRPYLMRMDDLLAEPDSDDESVDGGELDGDVTHEEKENTSGGKKSTTPTPEEVKANGEPIKGDNLHHQEANQPNQSKAEGTSAAAAQSDSRDEATLQCKTLCWLVAGVWFSAWLVL